MSTLHSHSTCHVCCDDTHTWIPWQGSGKIGDPWLLYIMLLKDCGLEVQCCNMLFADVSRSLAYYARQLACSLQACSAVNVSMSGRAVFALCPLLSSCRSASRGLPQKEASKQSGYGNYSSWLNMTMALVCAGSCEIVRQVVRFFEENANESIVDSTKLYQGCSIETVRH